jgi:pSer/pThr/pTyr-binding forkhead associated (FHA) protein
MVQLKILSGKMAGAQVAARHFPFRIGRSASSDLQLEEQGVWEKHLEINFDSTDGFILTSQPNAIVAVNGERSDQRTLRNGDSIEIGALKIRFWLSETRQYGLRLREWLTWLAIAAVTGGQLWLIYWLGD